LFNKPTKQQQQSNNKLEYKNSYAFNVQANTKSGLQLIIAQMYNVRYTELKC